MEIKESVEIMAPRERVFSLLLDVEKRMRLNPAYGSALPRPLQKQHGALDLCRSKTYMRLRSTGSWRKN